VAVVIKTAPDRVGRTIGYGTAFVNSGRRVCCALKPLEKVENFSEICPPFVRLRGLRRAFSG